MIMLTVKISIFHNIIFIFLGLGYKIQKVFFKLDELEKLLPENQQNQKQKISEAKDFLLVGT